MKKLSCLFLIATLILSLFACGNKETSQSTKDPSVPDNTQSSIASDESPTQRSKPQTSDDLDMDLTKLSSTMVYSEVYNMMYTPDDYIGKTVKMKGQFAYYEDPDAKSQYFACIIADATACCSQGLEFILTGEHT